jgi:hypothetical protein
MKKLTVILLTLMVMMSACSSPIKKLDLTNVTFVDYYYGSEDLIPAIAYFPLENYYLKQMTAYLKFESWVAIKKPAGTIGSVFTLRDFRQRNFGFSLNEDKMLVVIKDISSTYYYQGDKEDYLALKSLIQSIHDQKYVPDLSGLVLEFALPNGENTLISDFVGLTPQQSTALIQLLKLEDWRVSVITVTPEYGYELILKGQASLTIGFRREGNQELAVIRNTLSQEYTVYEVPSGVKEAMRSLIKSYVVVDHPGGSFLETRFVQSYIGLVDGFVEPVMLPEYIYTLTADQTTQLNHLFDLSKWEVMRSTPQIYYYTYGLIDTKGNRFYFAQDGDGSVVMVNSADPLVEPVYYAIRDLSTASVRVLLGAWYVPQKPSAAVRSLDFIKVFSGMDENGTESVYLYDLTASQVLELKEIMKMDSWIQSYNIPPMGPSAAYLVKTTDSIHLFISTLSNQAWFLITDEKLESPQTLGYYAPMSVYDAVVAYLKKHTP